MVANPEAYKVMGPRHAGACEFYGCNEAEGLDRKGRVHCSAYLDKEDPEPPGHLVEFHQKVNPRRVKKWAH